MRTNCLIKAWKDYIKGEATWVAFRRSDYSPLLGRMPLPLQLTGWIILYPATLMWLLGHYLIFGTWPHYVSCKTIRGDCYEVVPDKPKGTRLIPPPLFKAREQKMPYSNNLREKDIEEILERTAKQILNVMSRAQEDYKDLLEAYNYAGGTAADFAKVIYATDTPTPEQEAFVDDAITAGQAINTINTAVTNNADALRRFS